jgi:hypothetical protein
MVVLIGASFGSEYFNPPAADEGLILRLLGRLKFFD